MIKQTVRLLRGRQTEAEAALWQQLRNRKLNGNKFVRQYPVQFEYMQKKRFLVLDFYCHQVKLGIEIDGSIHDGRKEIDKYRKTILAQKGIQIVRFKNDDVLKNMIKVLQNIDDTISSNSHPSLLREGQGVSCNELH
jgi:very-short-patch-repair endonuclease